MGNIFELLPNWVLIICDSDCGTDSFPVILTFSFYQDATEVKCHKIITPKMGFSKEVLTPKMGFSKEGLDLFWMD